MRYWFVIWALLLIGLSIESKAQVFIHVFDAETGQDIQSGKIITNKGDTLSFSDQQLNNLTKGDRVLIQAKGYFPVQLNLSATNNIHLNPDNAQLAEINVSAGSHIQPVKKSTGSISIIEEQQINENAGITLSESLNQAPGITMQTGAYNTNRIVIRGVGSRSPYATNRIRVFIDQVPLTSAEGITAIENIPPEFISRMEIVKGPSSALYGSGLGGVIVLSPLYPDIPGISGQLNAGAGSFGLIKFGGQLGVKTEQQGVLGSFQHMQSNGFRENSNFERTSAMINGTLFYPKAKVNYHFNAEKVKAYIPSSLSYTDYMNEPETAADNWNSVEGHERYQQALGGVNLHYRFNQALSNQTSLSTKVYNGYESRPFNILDDESMTLTLKNLWGWENHWVNIKAGIEASVETYNWWIYETVGGTKGALESQFSEDRYFANAFIYSLLRAGNAWRFSLALNLHQLEYVVHDQFVTIQDKSGQYSTPLIVSPGLGMNYEATNNINFFASFNHGFSDPTIEESLLPEGAVNTNLKPEKGYSFEGGVRAQALDQHLFADVTGYAQFLSDLLVTKRESESVFYGINAGKTQHFGVEIFARYILLKLSEKQHTGLQFSFSQTLSQNQFVEFIDDGSDYGGNHLPGIPASNTWSSARVEHKYGIYGTIEIHHQGKQYLDDANTKTYAGHTLVNASAGYRSNRNATINYQLFVKANNLFNTHYASMLLINAPSFGGNPTRDYYPGRPFNFKVGVKLILN